MALRGTLHGYIRGKLTFLPLSLTMTTLLSILQPHPENTLHLRLHRARSVVLTAQEFVSPGHPPDHTLTPRRKQTRRDPRRAAHVRGRVHPHGAGAVLVRAGGAEDLHGGVLQYRGAVRDVWRGDPAGEHIQAV